MEVRRWWQARANSLFSLRQGHVPKGPAAEHPALERAHAIYDELLARRAHEYVPPFALAVCASALGDHETAMAFSAEAVEGRDVMLGLFHSWVPDLDPLRADPRFARLIDYFNTRTRS
jgi:hypothetical protein